MLKVSNIILNSLSDDIYIKQLTLNDAQSYFDLIEYDREHLSQYGDTTSRKYQKVDDVVASIVNPSNPHKYRFGVFVKNKMVGSVNLTPKDNTSAEIGVWIGKEHVGNAYAYKGMLLLLDFAFNILNLDNVFALITIGNTPSKKSIEKLGFILENTAISENYWKYNLTREKFLLV